MMMHLNGYLNVSLYIFVCIVSTQIMCEWSQYETQLHVYRHMDGDITYKSGHISKQG